MATPDRIQAAGQLNTTGTTSSNTCTFPNTTTTGSLIVVHCNAWATSGRPSFSVADNKGNTYVRVATLDYSTDKTVEQWHCPNAIGGVGHTITVSNSNVGSNINVSIEEYSGVDTSSPLDKTNTGTGNNTAPTSAATATLTQGNELVVGTAGTAGAATVMGAGVPYQLNANLGAGDPGLGSEWQAVSVTTAVASLFTMSVSQVWGALVATYKASTTPDTLKPSVWSKFPKYKLVR